MSDEQLDATKYRTIVKFQELKVREGALRSQLRTYGSELSNLGQDLMRGGAPQSHTRVPNFEAVAAALADIKMVVKELDDCSKELQSMGVDVSIFR